MENTIVAVSFNIKHTRYLDESGKPINALPPDARGPAILTALYRALVQTRAFDAKAIALQRTGRIGTYASSIGQEAVSVGVASAMRTDDVYHRAVTGGEAGRFLKAMIDDLEKRH